MQARRMRAACARPHARWRKPGSPVFHHMLLRPAQAWPPFPQTCSPSDATTSSMAGTAVRLCTRISWPRSAASCTHTSRKQGRAGQGRTQRPPREPSCTPSGAESIYTAAGAAPAAPGRRRGGGAAAGRPCRSWRCCCRAPLPQLVALPPGAPPTAGGAAAGRPSHSWRRCCRAPLPQLAPPPGAPAAAGAALTAEPAAWLIF